MKWIIQFVLKQFAKRSAKKTGVAKLLKETDDIVQLNARNIENTLKGMGINPKNLTSTDDVLKAMNYHKAMMNQSLKQEFKGLGLGKGIKSLEKKKTPIVKDPTKEIIDWDKDPFRGWTPEVIEGGGLAPEKFIRVRNGFSTAMKLNSKSQNNQMVKQFIKKEC